MSTMKKKRPTLKETTAKITDIICGRLESLPPKERAKRVEKANKRINNIIKTSKKSDIHSTHGSLGEVPQTPLVARNHR